MTASPRGRRLVGGLLVALLAAGCPAPAPSGPVSKADAPRKRTSASPTATPGVGGSPLGATPSADAAPLRRPAGDVVVLRGSVAIDAAYAVGTGAAIVANNGAAVVAAGAAALLSNNGGGLIANNGGNLIASHGGSLISDRGAGIVANNGAGVVANNGPSRTSMSSGAFLLPGDRAGYALAQAPALGALLPAAGAVLGVVSLRDGEPVSLGEDAAGAPVLAVYTDAAGAYEVFVPAALTGNVLVRVRFPRDGSAPLDARLAYDVITPPRADVATRIDEDTSLATRYLFDAFAGRFREFLTTQDPEATARALTTAWVGAPPGLQGLMLGLVQEFRAEAELVGLDDAPPAEVQRIARRVIEAAMTPVDLDTIVVTGASNTLWRWDDEPALVGLTAALKALREGAAEAITADPAYMAGQSWFGALNAGRTPPLEVRKPADVGEILVAEYYVRDMWGSYARAKVVFDAFGARTEPGTGIDQVDRISAATSAILTVLGQALITDQGGAKTASIGVVRAWKPAP